MYALTLRVDHMHAERVADEPDRARLVRNADDGCASQNAHSTRAQPASLTQSGLAWRLLYVMGNDAKKDGTVRRQVSGCY